jgi:hypothetical protein
LTADALIYGMERAVKMYRGVLEGEHSKTKSEIGLESNYVFDDIEKNMKEYKKGNIDKNTIQYEVLHGAFCIMQNINIDGFPEKDTNILELRKSDPDDIFIPCEFRESDFSKFYNESAKILYVYICVMGKNDTLFYPMAYLLRHSIELILKSILINHSYYLKKTDLNKYEELIKIINNDHELMKLWNKVFDAVKFHGLDKNEYTMPEFYKYKTIIEKNINNMNQLDSKSFSYRYPKDKNGRFIFEEKSVLKSPNKYISIKNYYESSQKIFNILCGINCVFSCLKE